MVESTKAATLVANARQRNRLNAVKMDSRHPGQTGKGLMIDDPEVVAPITELAERQKLSKREVVMQALEAMDLALMARRGDA